MKKAKVFKVAGASARLTPYLEHGVCCLTDVRSKNLGQGHARQLMESVVYFADQNDLTIELFAQRYGTTNPKALDNQQLVEFYSKFGFVVTPTSNRAPYLMTRVPVSQEIHTP